MKTCVCYKSFAFITQLDCCWSESNGTDVFCCCGNNKGNIILYRVRSAKHPEILSTLSPHESGQIMQRSCSLCKGGKEMEKHRGMDGMECNYYCASWKAEEGVRVKVKGSVALSAVTDYSLLK